MLQRALYPRTLPVKWLLPLLNRDHFTADFDLIYGVEHLRRLRDFTTEAERFNEHPSNRGWLRRRLGLRVSTSRMKALIRETLPPKSTATHSGLPVDEGTSAPFKTRASTSV
ncbi:MAG: hypothetical protein ABW223_13160 [Rariglobus sp.]